jgi:hypothetical protein
MQVCGEGAFLSILWHYVECSTSSSRFSCCQLSVTSTTTGKPQFRHTCTMLQTFIGFLQKRTVGVSNTHTHIYTYKQTCITTYIYIGIYTSVHAYIYICIYIYTYIHTYIYTRLAQFFISKSIASVVWSQACQLRCTACPYVYTHVKFLVRVNSRLPTRLCVGIPASDYYYYYYYN